MLIELILSGPCDTSVPARLHHRSFEDGSKAQVKMPSFSRETCHNQRENFRFVQKRCDSVMSAKTVAAGSLAYVLKMSAIGQRRSSMAAC